MRLSRLPRIGRSMKAGSPRGAHPWARAIDRLMPDSSRKTSRLTSRVFCSTRRAARASTTSSRSRWGGLQSPFSRNSKPLADPRVHRRHVDPDAELLVVGVDKLVHRAAGKRLQRLADELQALHCVPRRPTKPPGRGGLQRPRPALQLHPAAQRRLCWNWVYGLKGAKSLFAHFAHH